MVKYTDNVSFRIPVKCLAALAFLPVTDVIPAFESLAITFLNDGLPLLSYFENYFDWTACWGTASCLYLPSSDVERFRLCLDRVHQVNELTRGVSSHLQRTRILPAPYRVEATPSTGKTTEPHRRHPHPDSARGFLPYECEGDEEEQKIICTH